MKSSAAVADRERFEERLRVLWMQTDPRLSVSTIADRLGVSIGCVSGTVRRLNLPARAPRGMKRSTYQRLQAPAERDRLTPDERAQLREYEQRRRFGDLRPRRKAAPVVYDAAEVADWTAKHGVTRCPAAAAAQTTGEISAADQRALAEHYRERTWVYNR